MLFLTFFSTKAAVFYLFAHLSLVLFKNLNSFFFYIFIKNTNGTLQWAYLRVYALRGSRLLITIHISVLCSKHTEKKTKRAFLFFFFFFSFDLSPVFFF